MNFWLLSLLLSGIHLLGIWSALHAAARVRTSQGAIAWAISLLTLPYLALPLYWIFGRNRFHGYIETLRQAQRQLTIRHPASILQAFQAQLPPELENNLGLLGRVNDSVYTQGNALELLIDGKNTFTAILNAIRQAEHYLLIQFFIIRDDQLGRELHAALLAKSAQGVRVSLLYDEIGSHALNRQYLASLRADGVDARPFNTTRGWLNRFQLNFRNHRKMVIADGRIALTGGLNVGDDYLGQGALGYWRDTFLQLQGPAVQALQHAFLSDWYWATRQVLALNWTPVPAGKQTVLIQASGPVDRHDTCSMLFHQTIVEAKHRLWITSPYFVPSRAVFEALQLAALRGVDVRILLPEKPDHHLVYLASFDYLEAAEHAGIRIYRYQHGFLHQKVMLADQQIATVGTANLDNRSLFLNFEITALVIDSGFAAQIADMLDNDFKHSRLVKLDDLRSKGWLFYWAVRIARLFTPVL